MAGAPDGAVDGMFKIPGLRNVALTAPYFHNGSAGTLRQVVEFYNRGGNVDAPNKASQIKPLSLNEQDKNDLVAFLDALTDPRVLLQQAPFDHPELLIPNGASGDTQSVATSAPRRGGRRLPRAAGSWRGGARRRSSRSRTTVPAGFLQPPAGVPAGDRRPVRAAGADPALGARRRAAAA
jgi:hypothetical protein